MTQLDSSSRAAPGLSVVVTTYNRHQLLLETLRSILAQTVPVDEVIVVNDGGPNEVADLVCGLDPRVVYQYQPNAGMQSARNTGVRRCRYDWVAFSDDDDLWMPARAEHVKALAARERVDIVATDFSMFDATQTLVSSFFEKHRQRDPAFWATLKRTDHPLYARFDAFEPTRLLKESPFWGAILAVRRNAIEEIGGWDEGVRGIPSEDLHFVYRVSKGRSIGLIMEPTVRYRVHAGNVSHDNTRKFKGRVEIAERLRVHAKDPREQARIAEFIHEGLQTMLWAQLHTGDVQAAVNTAKRIGLGSLSPRLALKLAIALPRHLVGRRRGGV
jgi:GT2 family glycosyltransferase